MLEFSYENDVITKANIKYNKLSNDFTTDKIILLYGG